MADSVINKLKIHGEEKEVERLLEYIKGDKIIDFNKIIPMPEKLNLSHGTDTYRSIFWAMSKMPPEIRTRHINNLSNSKSSSIYADLISSLKEDLTIKDIPVVKEAADYFSPTDDMIKLGIHDYESLGNMYLANLDEYGYVDWYDWRIVNWGTKWNSYDTFVLNNNLIEFRTAEYTPRPIIAVLSEKFPSLSFEVLYADINLGYNVGKYTYQNGDIIDIYIPEGGTDMAKALSEEVWNPHLNDVYAIYNEYKKDNEELEK